MADYDLLAGDDDDEDLFAGDDDDDDDLVGDDDDDEVGGDPDVDQLLAGDDIEVGASIMRMSPAALAKKFGGGPLGKMVAKGMLKAKGRRAKKALIAKRRAKKRIAVVKRSPTRGGRSPLGVEQVVAAGASATINITVPVDFKPERLVVDDDTGPYFTISDVASAMRKHLVSSTAIKASVFSEKSDDNQDWRFPTIRGGQTYSMTVNNISGASKTFRAAWWGLWVE